MSADRPLVEKLRPFTDLMRGVGSGEAAIDAFSFHFNKVTLGDPGTLFEDDIEPAESAADSDQFDSFQDCGKGALDRVVVIKLNGGLGTGMGLESAKSLIHVRGGLTFLDLIVRQILTTRARTGAAIPMLLMNSAHTAGVAEGILASYPDLGHSDLPLGFTQNRVPKILAHDLTPAEHPRDDLRWCPPGHGDLYTAIAECGLLDRLLDLGFEYAFTSNADNLGAVLDPGLLGFMVSNGHDFVLEVADRTAADRKGGHLCLLANGRLGLRESAQCREEDRTAFQDVARHRYFNTNNLWLHLPTLADVLAHHGGFLPLHTIVNRKTLDPRDPSSPPVLQLETAMGSAVSLFEKAAAVRVPRRRFSPVKNTNDLLGVRSDAYSLTDDWLVVLQPDRGAPPVIDLDRRFFKMIDEFEKRFPGGPPSLQYCDSLTVEGDVTFGDGVIIEGTTTVRSDTPASVPPGSVLSGEISL